MRLRENLLSETVSDMAIREAVLVHATSTLREAAMLMQSRKLGCAIVVDQQDRPLGNFTERTLINALLQGPAVLDKDKVSDHTDTEVEFVELSSPIRAVWEAVVYKGMRFVGVVDQDGKVCGLTGQRGLSEYIAELYPQQIMVQRIGGKPGFEQREGA